MDKIKIFRRTDGKASIKGQQPFETKLLPAKCFKTHIGILVKLVRDEQGWCWHSTLNNGAGHGSTSSYTTDDIVLDGIQRTNDGFECAGCGAKKFVQCNSCRQLTCWSGKELWTCAFCGNTGYPSGTIKSVGALSDNKKQR